MTVSLGFFSFELQSATNDLRRAEAVREATEGSTIHHVAASRLNNMHRRIATQRNGTESEQIVT